jgi:3-oxoacyl-[acyl-carrier protein] reductase
MMLQEKIALVTGGSGAVGEAAVRVMAREGCRVAYTYNRSSERALKLQEELNAAASLADRPHPNPLPKGEGTRLQVAAYPLDVLDGKAAIALAETIEQEFGPIDILVNNAGFAQVLPFAMIEEDDWDRMMDVNVKGMFLVTKAFARGLIRRKRGSIVNVSSLAGVRMLEVPVHYATAKSAVVGFTLSLARELGRYKVRVNAVVPGMLTDGVSVNVPEKQQEEYKQYCALSRVGTPEEVGELIAFLASDRAAYINGQAIHVDGGI